MTKKLINIKFTPRNPGKAFTNIIPKYKPKWKKIMLSFQEDAEKLFKDRIPVRTGKTRRSITSRRKLNSTKFTGEIILSSRSPVVKFLDKGTKPSPGRYIPVLGRRIKTGSHPGIRGLNIIEGARQDIEFRARTTVKEMKEQFRKSVRESFR